MSDKNWSPYYALNPDEKKRQREKTGIYPAFFMIKLNYNKLHNNIQYTFFDFYSGYNRVTS